MDVEGTAGRLDIVIVAMTSEHLDDVIALWERTDGLLLSDADRPENLDRYLSRNPGLSHIAICEDRIIGAVLCGHDGRRGYLYHLAVAPEHRTQGIGRALVNACLVGLRDARILRCNLFVLDGNDDGKRFWSKGGWYDWPEIRLMSKDWEKADTSGAAS